MRKRFFYGILVMAMLTLTIALMPVFAQASKLPPESALPPQAAVAFKGAGLPVLKKAVAPEDFALALLGGGEQRLSGLKGQVVFLNFWATWCPPCRAEMPAMEALYRRFKDNGLAMLAVDSGEKEAAVSAFIKRNGFSYPVALDSAGRVSAVYAVQAIPTTYIIDRGGLIVSRVTGSLRWDDPAVIKAFEELLK
jgi:thiol-disulfide isomerase/thioredoxin